MYESPIGSEFEEVELGEGGGEFEELGEFGESLGASEQVLGEILGSVAGGEVGGPLTEAQEIELASELLEIGNEQELEQFLGNVFKKVAQGVGSFIKSPVGRALGGVLKSVAKKALPVVGGALGSMVAPGIGTALGSKLGSMASGLFEVQLEALPQEQAEYEVARRYVGLAASAARHAALARPHAAVNPLTVARAAVTRAARTYAPGLYKQMARSLAAGVARPGFARSPGSPLYRRPVPGAPSMRPVPGRPMYAPAVGAPDTVPTAAPLGIPDDAFAPVEPATDGMPLSGRWVRRGRKIIVLGV
jgi:hypothetical protein